MSKINNRGGFTLAELLIVIAIIAILIAIAIPVFGAQLENARISADHANMRTAYSIVQTANIMGTSGSTDVVDVAVSNGDYFCADGAFHAAGAAGAGGSTAPANAVTIQASSSNDSCATCVVTHSTHTAGQHIKAAYVSGSSGPLKVEIAE